MTTPHVIDYETFGDELILRSAICLPQKEVKSILVISNHLSSCFNNYTQWPKTTSQPLVSPLLVSLVPVFTRTEPAHALAFQMMHKAPGARVRGILRVRKAVATFRLLRRQTKSIIPHSRGARQGLRTTL